MSSKRRKTVAPNRFLSNNSDDNDSEFGQSQPSTVRDPSTVNITDNNGNANLQAMHFAEQRLNQIIEQLNSLKERFNLPCLLSQQNLLTTNNNNNFEVSSNDL